MCECSEASVKSGSLVWWTNTPLVQSLVDCCFSFLLFISSNSFLWVLQLNFRKKAATINLSSRHYITCKNTLGDTFLSYNSYSCLYFNHIHSFVDPYILLCSCLYFNHIHSFVDPYILLVLFSSFSSRKLPEKHIYVCCIIYQGSLSIFCFPNILELSFYYKLKFADPYNLRNPSS